VAVVLGADDLTRVQMQRFANWTNLSETTFVMKADDEAADYRVRIFTPDVELPFAGHPTIGTCHAWLEAGGVPQGDGVIVQECGAGLVTLSRTGERLAFAAPPMTRSGPVSEDDMTLVRAVVDLPANKIVDAAWVDNGPGWLGVLLDSADTVRGLQPNFAAGNATGVGIVGPSPLGVAGLADAGQEVAMEVRAFFASGGQPTEDPVTGSLNASLAQWLTGAGHVAAPYVAGQGSAINRDGRVFITEVDGNIWVGGNAVTCVDGEVLI